MRKIKKIIIHCADTYPDMDIGVEEIRKWHLDRGWDDVGYHHIIRRNGDCELGRDEDIQGAHAAGHNLDSIGVCLVGGKSKQTDGPEFNFTKEQIRALWAMVELLKNRYQIDMVIGHNQVSDKDCPCFNVKAMFS